jgi:hypothetical protein
VKKEGHEEREEKIMGRKEEEIEKRWGKKDRGEKV